MVIESEVMRMTDYEKLKNLYEQIDIFENSNMTGYSPKFREWHRECKKFLEDTYGKDSLETKTFSEIRFIPDEMDDNIIRLVFKNELVRANVLLSNLLVYQKESTTVTANKTVFIVHGHDEGLKYKVENLLIKLELNPIILHKQTNSSRTIIEKIEKFGIEASAAIILLTPDDVGKAKKETEFKNRARQNVVFEAGFFMGHFGRDRVILVVSDKSIEMPNDLSGIVYTESSGDLEIARELKAMGFEIDMNKLF